MTEAAQIAADEFTTRRAAASKRIADRRWSPAEAEARMLPWLHVAAMAGAQLPAVYEDGVTLFPLDRAGEQVRLPMSLFLSADDRHAARIALLDALDDAIAQAEADPARLPRARRLLALAAHLGAARMRPASPARAA